MQENLVTTYRKNASYCRVKAARAPDDELKRKWLEFAAQWELLADKARREGDWIEQEVGRAPPSS